MYLFLILSSFLSLVIGRSNLYTREGVGASNMKKDLVNHSILKPSTGGLQIDCTNMSVIMSLVCITIYFHMCVL